MAMQLWFTRVLRDGFATAAADSRAFAPFSAIAEHHLYAMLGCALPVPVHVVLRPSLTVAEAPI